MQSSALICACTPLSALQDDDDAEPNTKNSDADSAGDTLKIVQLLLDHMRFERALRIIKLIVLMFPV